ATSGSIGLSIVVIPIGTPHRDIGPIASMVLYNGA
ncbi:unnamed protein product, partial [marine sediment metagenome]